MYATTKRKFNSARVCQNLIKICQPHERPKKKKKVVYHEIKFMSTVIVVKSLSVIFPCTDLFFPTL